MLHPIYPKTVHVGPGVRRDLQRDGERRVHLSRLPERLHERPRLRLQDHHAAPGLCPDRVPGSLRLRKQVTLYSTQLEGEEEVV